MNRNHTLDEYWRYVAPVCDYKKYPILQKGKGCYLYDIDGKEYLDLNGGQFCSIFGYGDQELERVVAKSISTLGHLNSNFISDEVLVAAKNVSTLCPEMCGRVFFLSTGAEANECALRFAKNMNHNKPGIISFDKGYHGLTHGTEGYSMGRAWVKPGLGDSYIISAPCSYGRTVKEDLEKCLDQFKHTVRNHGDTIAAAIFEPIISSGGMIFPPKEFWTDIQKICRQNNIYIIFDECQTGFGRTGSWFYYQQLGCVPDFLVCAKGMGVGYPVSVVIFNGNTIPEDKFKMHHFSSHQNDPLAASIVSFAVDKIRRDRMLERIQSLGGIYLSNLKKLSAKYPGFIMNPRGAGLMCGFDFNTEGMDKAEIQKQYEEFCFEALRHQLILQGADGGKTMRILPEYYITDEESRFFFEKLDETVQCFLER